MVEVKGDCTLEFVEHYLGERKIEHFIDSRKFEKYHTLAVVCNEQEMKALLQEPWISCIEETPYLEM
jgi:hypothetical protein